VVLLHLDNKQHDDNASWLPPPPPQQQQQQQQPPSSSSTRQPPPVTDNVSVDVVNVVVIKEVIHRAFFGLGHRLHRSAAAYHLATHPLKENATITHFRFHWESCRRRRRLAPADDENLMTTTKKKKENTTTTAQEEVVVVDDYNVFRYLFGSDVWELEERPTLATMESLAAATASTTATTSNSTTTTTTTHYYRKMMVIRNDVYGYIKGQLYKDLHLPLPASTSDNNNSNNNGTTITAATTSSSNYFDDKLRSDVEFYQRLIRHYRFQSTIDNFQRQTHSFDDRLVVGVHLRVGNGEGRHFQQANRGVVINETVFVDNVIRTLGVMLTTKQQQQQQQEAINASNYSLPPLIFLATDTAHLIPVFQDKSKQVLNIETVVFDQLRLPVHQGVTFEALQGQGQACLDGWQGMMSDMILLSRVNILVATRYSTFTQSLPLSMMFHHQQSFCEASHDGTAMTCVAGRIQNWLFRNDPSHIHTYNSLHDDNKNDDNDMDMEESPPPPSPPQPVQHPITLLLPDVEPPPELAQAQHFFGQPLQPPLDQKKKVTMEAIFPYGHSKLFQKYRNNNNNNHPQKNRPSKTSSAAAVVVGAAADDDDAAAASSSEPQWNSVSRDSNTNNNNNNK
jgi:hypothetical protein